MTKKPTLLVTASTFPRWPEDSNPPFILSLCVELSRHFTVHVLVPHCEGASERETVEGLHVTRFRYAPVRWQKLAYEGGMLNTVRRSPWTAALVPAFVAAQWFAVRRLHRRHRFAAVHAHWIIPQGIVLSLAAPPVPTLLTSHGGDLYAMNSTLGRSLKRWVLRSVTHVTVVSRPMADECRSLGVPASKITVRSMGIDTRRLFRPPTVVASGRSRRILFVGRLVDKKGVDVLIEAAGLLHAEGVEFELDIVGDGPERESLEAQASLAGLSSRVRFVGAIPNDRLPAYYGRSGLFVLPSVIAASGDREGLGLVSVEAMACGCCVVASDLPAVRDVVTSGVDGVLVESGSAVALARELGSLLGSEQRVERLSREAIEKARTFDWETVGTAYRTLLEELVGGDGGTTGRSAPDQDDRSKT